MPYLVVLIALALLIRGCSTVSVLAAWSLAASWHLRVSNSLVVSGSRVLVPLPNNLCPGEVSRPSEDVLRKSSRARFGFCFPSRALRMILSIVLTLK